MKIPQRGLRAVTDDARKLLRMAWYAALCTCSGLATVESASSAFMLVLAIHRALASTDPLDAMLAYWGIFLRLAWAGEALSNAFQHGRRLYQATSARVPDDFIEKN